MTGVRFSVEESWVGLGSDTGPMTLMLVSYAVMSKRLTAWQSSRRRHLNQMRLPATASIKVLVDIALYVPHSRNVQ